MIKSLSLLISFSLLLIAVNGDFRSAKKRVCVIGAGAAGLISTKLLSLYPDEFETIVFEKQSDVGGLWIYTESTTVDEHGLPVHSSIYKNLRLNGPVELQTFPDFEQFKWDDRNSSFVGREQMLKYLQSYAEHFNLRRFIKLNTNVEQVSPLSKKRWLVATRDLNTKRRDETECDAVIVANGNNFKGNIPKLPGIESFPGRVIHSHVYRHPEEFANQTVVVLGASFSGLDISVDVSRFADKIYLSHRQQRLSTELPKNVEVVLGVVGVEGSELILSDGSRIKADALILCTGYIFDYPFLDKSSGIYVDDNGKWIHTVYKHLINVERPTMAILNLPHPSAPCQVPRAQAAYFIATLRGKLKLPSRDEMLKDAQLPPGVAKSKAHYMIFETVDYYNELAKAAGAEPLKSWYGPSVYAYIPQLYSDFLHFREKRLHFKADGTVEFY